MTAPIQTIKIVCDLLAFGLCWGSVAAFLSGVVQPTVIILSAGASFVWIIIQIQQSYKKNK